MANNQANAKQHPNPEFLPFENYSYSSSTLPSRNNRTYSVKYNQKSKYVCIHEIMQLIIMKMKMKMKMKKDHIDTS